MKTLLSFLTVMMVFVGLALAQTPEAQPVNSVPTVSAEGGGGGGGSTTTTPAPTDFVDAEQAAMEYLSKEPTVKFQCGFRCVLEKQGFPSKDEESQFVLENGQITYQTINNVVICDVSRGDSPLSGLYPPADGWLRTNFSIWASGQDANGQPTLFGYAGYDILKPGQPISIALEPQASMRLIPRPDSIPAGSSMDIQFLNYDANGYYDSAKDAFVVWVQPFRPTPPAWQIINPTTGQILATGTISFLPQESPVVNPASAISLTSKNGTVEIIWNQWDECYLSDQQWLGWTNRKGEAIACTVYRTDLAGKPLYARAGNLVNGLIVVKDYDTKEIITVSKIDQWGNPEMNDMIVGFDKVIITVTGQITDPKAGFWIFFTKNQYNGKG